MELKTANIQASTGSVTLWVDDQPIAALPEETIAAALARQNIVALRQTGDGEKRGLWCGMGSCYECVVHIEGCGSQRSCMTPVTAGMRVYTSPVAAGKLPSPPPLHSLPPLEKKCDVLVVGAGAAGLSAALSAALCGASVLVLDERPQSGGQFFKPLAPSHRLQGKVPRQWADGAKLLAEAKNAGAEIIQNATVWAAFSPQEIAATIDGQPWVIRPKQLIIAAGAYERPVPFPGWTLPGVMTTGAGQTLAKSYRVMPGKQILVSGNGPLNLQFAAELLEAGGQVTAVLESARKPGPGEIRQILTLAKTAPGLVLKGQHYLNILKKHRTPFRWGEMVTEAHGDGKLERVTVMSVDRQGQLLPETARQITCDVLCLGHGFIPSTDLARMLGCEQQLSQVPFSTPTIITDKNGASSVPGVFVIGDGARLAGAQVAQARGTLAGQTAASALGYPSRITHRAGTERKLQQAEIFQKALWKIYQAPPVSLHTLSDETIICRCENLSLRTLRQAISNGLDTPAALKRNLRVGMGLCQGRTCAGMVAQLVSEMTERQSNTASFFAPRLPVRPMPINALTAEKPEWGGHKPAITPNLARPVETTPREVQHAWILVIGGGVMGNCLAYYLAKQGADVMVVERDDINLQASGANAGSLHVQLLSFDFGDKAQHGGGPAAETLPLGPLSVALWQALEKESGESLEIKMTGGLMVAGTAQEMRALEKKVALERQYGLDVSLLDASELAALSPNLSPHLLGAEYCPQEGKINPLRATYVVNRMARDRGARFQRGTDVRAIERQNNGHFRVVTDRGIIIARQVINAAGAWAGKIGEMVGAAIPVRGAPLQMIVTERAPPLIDHLIAHAGRHLSLKQTAHGSLLIGGGWSAGFNPEMRMNQVLRESIEGNLWVAGNVLPPLRQLHMVRSWAGMNINIDGAPIIGDLPGVPGFWNAVTSNGYTLAPVVAHSLAQQILNGHCDINLAPYHINRFNSPTRKLA